MFSFPRMLKVFRDQALLDAFEKDGFVIVPFYTDSEIKELTDLYYRLHPKDEKGFFPSTFSKDLNYRTIADSEIRRVDQRAIDQYLENYKVICGSFIVKSPGPESAMCVHQDMTLVDESKYTGINIWVPLCDLTPTNGAIQALWGSHRLYPTYRHSSIPNFYESIDNEIKPYLETLYLKAGQALIFDQSIIHFSEANMSDKVRIVCNTFFTNKDAKFNISYWNKDFAPNKVELFEQDDTFMTNFEQFGENIADRPKIGKSMGLVDYNFPKMTLEDLHRIYGKPKEELPVKKPLLKRVFESLFQ